MAIDQKTIDEVKAKYPNAKLSKLVKGASEIIVKHPGPTEYRKAKAQVKDPAHALDANENFVRDCLVYPDQNAFSAMLSERPGLADTFAGELTEIAGATGACEVVPL